MVFCDSSTDKLRQRAVTYAEHAGDYSSNSQEVSCGIMIQMRVVVEEVEKVDNSGYIL